MSKTITLSSKEIGEAIDRLYEAVLETHKNTTRLLIVSVADGGNVLATRLADRLGNTLNKTIPCGSVNTAFHRDDIGLKPIPKNFGKTELPLEIDDTVIILVDDVVSTGRTTRAAINELFDQGRPDRIELLTLCDRGNRSLPIQPDYTGINMKTNPKQLVEVHLNPHNQRQDSIIIKPE